LDHTLPSGHESLDLDFSSGSAAAAVPQTVECMQILLRRRGVPILHTLALNLGQAAGGNRAARMLQETHARGLLAGVTRTELTDVVLRSAFPEPPWPWQGLSILPRALRWLQDSHLFELSADMCLRAASEGSAEHLRFLRERGCAWDKRACLQALSGRHLPEDARAEIVAWAQEQPE
jgi:hypothetical protein